MYTSICSKASYLLDSEILRDVQTSNRTSSRLFKTVGEECIFSEHYDVSEVKSPGGSSLLVHFKDRGKPCLSVLIPGRGVVLCKCCTCP